MFPKELKKDFTNHKYERTEEGIFFPASGLLAKGVFKYNKRGEIEESSENLVVDEALDYILSAALGVSSPLSNWYIAPFSGDVTVLATWTAANFTANSTEFTNYTASNRPSWSKGSVASGGVDSFASKAEFESTADSQVIRGAALISSATKSGTSGTLIAASRFASDKALDTDEILDVGYGLQLTAV